MPAPAGVQTQLPDPSRTVVPAPERDVKGRIRATSTGRKRVVFIGVTILWVCVCVVGWWDLTRRNAYTTSKHFFFRALYALILMICQDI
jgi:hypothetical protein